MLDMSELVSRLWNDLTARRALAHEQPFFGGFLGPFGIRFILQPAMALFLAIRDGIKDARNARSPYFWTIWSDPARRGPRLREGIRAVARVLILGALMDILYQLIMVHALRPLETVVITLLLAFVPYLIARGPAYRIAKRLIDRKAAIRPKNEVDRR